MFIPFSGLEPLRQETFSHFTLMIYTALKGASDVHVRFIRSVLSYSY